MRVRDTMTVDVATVTPSTPLKDAARLLVERRISGVPVVDGGTVVGVLSEADVLEKERGGRLPQRRGALARLLDRNGSPEPLKLEARTVGDAMSSPAITVEPEWTIPSAAERMLESGINRLPVVRQGRLVGIVTRADLVRAFARSDEQIETDVREEIAFQKGLWLDDSPIEIQVDQGETVLSGRVRLRSQADALPKVVARVPGVVTVRAHLQWSEDDV